MLEDFLGGVLRAAGDVLESLLGLGALLRKAIQKVAVLIEDDAIVLAGVRQLADFLIELIHGLVGGEVIGFQAEERFDESVDFLSRVLGAASEVLVRVGGILRGGGRLAVSIYRVLGCLAFLIGLLGSIIVGL